MDALDKLLKAHPVVLVNNSFSPYCMEARDILAAYGLDQEKYRLFLTDEEAGGDAIAKASIDRTGQKNLPHIYINGVFIGGLDELRDLKKHNKLQGILVDSTALKGPDMGPLESLIKSTSLVVIENSYSPYCFSVRELVNLYDIEATKQRFIDVDKDENGSVIEKAAIFKTKNGKLPLIFLNGEYIGTYTELKAHHDARVLESMLVKAGAIPTPQAGVLDSLKTESSLLVLTNSFSAYCLSVNSILERYALNKSAKVIYLDNAPNGSDLQRAARLQTKVRDPPYIWMDSKVIDTQTFIKHHEQGSLREDLIKCGAVERPKTTHLEALIRESADKRTLLILTNQYSPFCIEAAAILENYKIPANKINSVDLDTVADAKMLEDAACYMTNQKSAPFIYVEGKHIGGCEQLQQLHKTGELKKLLTKASVL